MDRQMCVVYEYFMELIRLIEHLICTVHGKFMSTSEFRIECVQI